MYIQLAEPFLKFWSIEIIESTFLFIHSLYQCKIKFNSSVHLSVIVYMDGFCGILFDKWSIVENLICIEDHITRVKAVLDTIFNQQPLGKFWIACKFAFPTACEQIKYIMTI